jgi:lysine 6-dehydrogenase
VLGAGGTIGPAIARDLAASDEADELRLLDLDERRAEAVADAIDSPKVRAAGVDAGDSEALSAAIAGCDTLVNAASYRLNLKAMEASVAAQSHYLDLGGLYWMTAEQMRSFAPPDGEDRFAAIGRLALLGIGSAPGKTNLMAAKAVGELAADPGTPGRAAEDVPGIDSIDVSAAGRDLDPPAGFSVPYALRTLVDELTLPPVVIRDGEAVEVEPLAPGGDVDFGDPIGEAETILTLHSEMLTFPQSFGCKAGGFRLSLHPELLERLGELADASEVEVARAASEALPPSAQTVSVHVVDVAGGGRNVRVRSVTHPVEGLGLGGGVVSTAAPAAAAARLIARGAITARGVNPPERCIDPADMFAELEQRGSVFDVETRSEANPATPGREAEEVAGR